MPRIIQNISELTISEIESAIGMKDITITHHIPPVSRGSVNEYHSDADYWWPPENGQGPYVHRDGETNPHIFIHHRLSLRALRKRVAVLTLASNSIGPFHKEAIESLQRQLGIFFVNPETRMEPHLKFSQGIEGRCQGRSPGIIDGLHFAEIAIALRQWAMCQPVDMLTEIRQWFRDYYIFLITSAWGQKEASRENNHATAYWVQIASIALFLGDEDGITKAKTWLENSLYPEQMSQEGFFPAELQRTKPLGYSIFQVNLLSALHQLIALAGYPDTWHFSLPDGRGFKRALLWIAPYMIEPETWPYKRDVQFFSNWQVRHPALFIGAQPLGLDELTKKAESLSPFLEPAEVERNMPAHCYPLWLN